MYCSDNDGVGANQTALNFTVISTTILSDTLLPCIYGFNSNGAVGNRCQVTTNNTQIVLKFSQTSYSTRYYPLNTSGAIYYYSYLA